MGSRRVLAACRVFILTWISFSWSVPVNAKRMKGCILYQDTRKMEVPPHENSPWNYMEERGRDLPYYVATKFINKRYAKQHKYKYIVSDGQKYGTARAGSWYKIPFIKEQLQCCCDWVFFLDSDAYFRMNDHTLSVEKWLEDLTAENHFDALLKRGVNLQGQTWFPEDPIRLVEQKSRTRLIGLFPRNGDNKGGFCNHGLFSDPPGGCETLNAGIMLLRNSKATLKFLDEWYDEPNTTMYYTRPWEQHRLAVISPKYQKRIVVVPYAEATGPGGLYIRHIWSATRAARHALTREAALGVLALDNV